MEDDDNISTSSLDHGVDKETKGQAPSQEKYKDNLVNTHTAIPTTAGDTKRSWTMTEIERQVATSVLPSRSKKLAQYGLDFARRNDFRMKNLGRKLTSDMRRDFDKEITKGPITSRIREFDLQSQTMRMVAANASLGSFQFQKTVHRPYMVKNLALGYQKIDLLKQMVTGISSLEKALLSKLEAIKVNTSAPEDVKNKLSYFRRIREEIKTHNIKKVANNISDTMLNRYNDQYQKHVVPLAKRLHSTMTNPGKGGGINGVLGMFTRKMNNIRHTAQQMGSVDPTNLTAFGRIKQRAASAAATGLNGAVRVGQRVKVPGFAHGMLSKSLQSFTSFFEAVDPFATGGKHKPPVVDPNAPPPLPGPIGGGESGDCCDKLISAFNNWRKEYRHDNDHIVDHLAAIRVAINPNKIKRGSPPIPVSPLTGTKLTTRFGGNAPVKHAPLPVTSTKANIITPLILPSIRPAETKVPFGPTRSHVTQTINLHAPHGPHGAPTPTGRPGSPKPSPTESKLLQGISKLFSQTKDTTKVKLGDSKFLHTSFDKISKSLAGLGGALKKKVTPIGEQRIEAHKTSLLTRIATRAKQRKGSYEDLMAERKANGQFPYRRGAAEAGSAAAGADAGLADAEAANERATSGMNGGYLAAALGLAGSTVGSVGKGALKYGWKGSKFLAGKTVKNTPKALKLAMKGAKGLTKFSAKEIMGLAKLTGRVGGKGILGALRLGGTGLLKFGKSGFGVGTAAMIGQHFWDKGRKDGAVKRSGDTVLSMAQYGAMGAEIGGLFAGVGAIPGAAIGAGIGAVIANADYAAKALRAVGHGAVIGAQGLWYGIFGQSAIVGRDGTVKRQETSSILGDMKIAFFGRKAKFSKSGDVIAPERMTLYGDIRYGFQKLLFGDKFDNGAYKEGTSVVSMVASGVTKAVMAFGKKLAALPGQVGRGLTNLKDGTVNLLKKGKDKVVSGANAVGTAVKNAAIAVHKKVTNTKKSVSDFAHGAARGSLSWKSVGDVAKSVLTMDFKATPFGLGVDAGAAAFGWAVQTGAINNSSSPYFPYVTEVLRAYGVTSRDMFGYLHSLEQTQDKINKGQLKDFTDADMAYSASRFGFDPKSKEPVGYFKLWFKRRFIPALGTVDTVLRKHKQTFSSVLSASETEISAITADLKKEINSAGLVAIGLEPSVAAYNKYAKIGTSNAAGSATNATASPGGSGKPLDSRDPRTVSSNGQSSGKAAFQWGSAFSLSGANGSGSNRDPFGQQAKAERKSAALSKGGVKDQVDFKAAYAKLPPNLKKVVDKSKSLQFVLWSTSVQHGPDTAVKIFMKDYSDKLSDKDNIRSIYQDRSTKFGDLSGDDRTEASAHLGEEERFALGIDGGASPDMGSMAHELSNVVSTQGSEGYDSSGIKAAKVTGDVSSRAKDAVQYLMGKKYTKTAAVAVVANLITESALKTDAVGDRGAAHGIAQWHSGRRKDIGDHFKKPVEGMNLHEQLDAVDWEISTHHGVTGKSDLKAALNSAQDVGAAVADMVDRYERPADREGNKRSRTAIALGLLKNLGSDAGNAGKPAAPAAPGAASGAKPAASAAAPATKPAAKAPTTTSAPNGAANAAQVAHTKAMQDLGQHLQNNTAAVKGASAAKPAAPAGNTTVVAPTTVHHAPAQQDSFLTMSMKKMAAAIGE